MATQERDQDREGNPAQEDRIDSLQGYKTALSRLTSRAIVLGPHLENLDDPNIIVIRVPFWHVKKVKTALDFNSPISVLNLVLPFWWREYFTQWSIDIR